MARSLPVELDEATWLSLDPRPGETLRLGLERALREAIVSGALRGGVRLPASRQLARALGVSRGVVMDAYDQLGSQGFLITRERSAPVVASIVRSAPAPLDARSGPLAPRYDLLPWTTDMNLFPLGRWLTTAERAAREGGRPALDYRDHRGELALREVLADHLGRTRGAIVDPQLIVVTQGTAQGIDIVLRMLKSEGATSFAVEDPGHTAQQARVRAAGLDLVGKPVDDHGLIVDDLEAAAVLVTPAHQFPTGAVLSGERRRQLMAWARASDGLIVEDDYDSEFRYDHEPVRALQGLAPDQVVLVGTVSKTLAPALRLGWLVVPPRLIDLATHTKRLADDFSPALDQLALAAFLRNGEYDRHIRKARRVYRARRGLLLDALRQHLPELEVAGVAAGLSLLLRLPDSIDDVSISERAAQARVRVLALSSFYLRRSSDRGLVIGYGGLHKAAIGEAVRVLASIVRAAMDG